MTKRYKPTGEWWLHDAREWNWWYPQTTCGITVHISDVVEVNGTIWHDGAHKVTVPAAVREITGKRSKTFIGETAWSDASRYASDLVSDMRFKLR